MHLMHTPEVRPGRKPEPTSRGAIPVSLEGRRVNAGLLFHPANRTIERAGGIDRGFAPYARFTQAACEFAPGADHRLT